MNTNKKLDANGNELVLNGRYITQHGISRRIPEGGEVQIMDLQHESHAYVYGVTGGSGYIRPDLLVPTGRIAVTPGYPMDTTTKAIV